MNRSAPRTPTPTARPTLVFDDRENADACYACGVQTRVLARCQRCDEHEHVCESCLESKPQHHCAAAATLGRLGGKARSSAKTAAARANGSRGGRPSGTAEGRLVAVYPGAIHDDGSLDWTRVTITTRRSATAAGARLAAKRAGYTLRRAGQPQNEGDWTTTTREGADIEVWMVEAV